jgi:glycosyltransferase involved in cell wall biosynthesis
MAPTLSVVVPAYQEARRAPRLVEAIRETATADAAAAGLELVEVVVVDDGSTDGTRAVLDEAARSLPLLRPMAAPGGHGGKGHAVAAGISAARAELVLLADCDLSAPLAEVARLHDALRAGADVAIGSRAANGADVRNTPLTREYMGRTFNRLVRAATGLPHHDTQCPLKLLRTADAQRLTERLRTRGFAFDVELLVRAQADGLAVAEVPIAFCHDLDSRVDPVAHALEMARAVALLRRAQRKPQRDARRQVHAAGDELPL